MAQLVYVLVGPAQKVAVLGAGPIGLERCVQACRDIKQATNSLHAMARLGCVQVGPGKKVAVLGAGPMGLNAAAAARAFAASRVAITDIRHSLAPVGHAGGP